MNFSNPIQLIVPIRVLNQKKQFKIHHNSSNHELLELTKILEIEELRSFSFKGQFIRSSKTDYLLHLSFKATLVQLCVVTLRPVKTKINHKFDQLFSVVKEATKRKNVSFNYDAIDKEHILNEVNIGDIVLEALSLEIPLYPKIQGANFKGLTITKAGMKPLEVISNNPFNSLKKFR